MLMGQKNMQNGIKQSGIYLSYAREDEAEAKRILRALKRWNFPVFFDQEMPSGVRWKTVLESQLQSSYAVVLVWSSRCSRSQWIRREIGAGLEKDRLFPVLIERGAKLPKKLRHIQFADLSDWNGRAKDPKFLRLLQLLQPVYEA